MKLCTLIHKNNDGSEVGILADVNVRFGKDVQISDGTGVEVHFGVIVGECVTIGPNVKLLGAAIIGNRAKLCDGVEVGWRAKVGQGAHLGHNVKLGPRSSVGPNVVVPDGTTVPADTHI